MRPCSSKPVNPGSRRRHRQRDPRRLPDGRRAQRSPHRRGGHGDVARLGRADTRRRPAGARLPTPRLLRLVSLLMIATGIGFAAVHRLLAARTRSGLIGTLNPSGGDVSVFLPTEQALLPATVPDAQRTALFARYSLIGRSSPRRRGARRACRGGAGVSTSPTHCVAVHLPRLRAARSDRAHAGTGTSRPAIERRGGATDARPRAVETTVYRLAALFSLDSFGGGFVITALLVLWLQRRFGLSLAVSGAVFFWAGLLSAFSALVAVRIAADRPRSHDGVHPPPGEQAVIITAFMPNAGSRCLPARPGRAVTDGRPGAQFVRDGGGHPRRTTGRRERHQRARGAWPRRSRQSPPDGCWANPTSAGRSSSEVQSRPSTTSSSSSSSANSTSRGALIKKSQRLRGVGRSASCARCRFWSHVDHEARWWRRDRDRRGGRRREGIRARAALPRPR